MGDAKRRFNPNLNKVMAAPSQSNTREEEVLPLVRLNAGDEFVSGGYVLKHS